MGLETSKRGLFTQQSALYTTGHNISNANTLGYSRQRVNMQATAGFPGVGLNAGTMPGFLGTGVEAGSIQRIRDSFVDQQFRQESNKLGYWESQTKAISQMEDVLNEPSYYGLQKSLSEFWQSLEDLATNPQNAGARKVVIGSGEAVVDSFHYMHKSLSDIQANLGNEISVTTKEINSVLQQIAQLNEQIANVEPNGYLPNDLYDARDILLDKLSTMVPIETSYVESGGRALAIAEGSVTVKLKLKDGTTVELVNKDKHANLGTDPSPLVAQDGTSIPIKGISFWAPGTDPTDPAATFTSIGHDDFADTGQLKSLINSYGKDDGAGGATGLYPDMIAELNKMAAAFANAFNEVHKGGTDFNGKQGEDFFKALDENGQPMVITAANIAIVQALKDDPNLLAASDSQEDIGNGEEGNGKNALNLAKVQFKALDQPGYDLGGATLETYYQGVIGQLGVVGRQAENNTINSATLLGAVEHRRASISSVSLDEELTDMIRFQQAYNASARMITVVDETLDKIISGMGVVGR
jgi:flagellar hook-associated protein 1 FlgK